MVDFVGMAAGVAWLATAAAADGPVCEPDHPVLDAYEYLRALSFDLRGVPPTAEEVESLRGDVDEASIDGWLDSAAFAARAVRHHRSLLWTTLEDASIFGVGVRFQVAGGGLYWRNVGPAIAYRGLNRQCQDRASDDLSAAAAADPTITVGEDGIAFQQVVDAATGIRFKQEGYVWVRPYWDPATPIKVCAYDAQEAEVSPRGVVCRTASGLSDAGCGCGPELRTCTTLAVENAIRNALVEELERRIATILGSDRPYTDLFTSRFAYVNGPLVHFWRHLTGRTGGLTVEPVPVPVAELPSLDWADGSRWTEIALGREAAGILTSPAFLLRFQTDRARATRFLEAFLCRPFAPPEGGLPAPDESCNTEPDLQRRCGCKYCHASLEPAAAHWGRWVSSGAGYLDPTSFPRVRQDCLTCALVGVGCSSECRRLYHVDALSPEEQPFLGTLNSYVFRRPEHERNIEVGPRLLALTGVVDGSLPACVTERTTEWLLGRALPRHDPAFEAMEAVFVQSGFSYRALVRAIVTHPIYRRVR